MQKVRKRRPQGERTHQAILEKAMGIASIDGINGLTIGRLAEDLGVSKSGLYAHFGSKLDLQLETIDSAIKVFFSEVVESGIQGPPGVARVIRLADSYLSYVERRVFPGGCFFAGLIPEVDAQEGPIRDALAAMVRTWEQILEQSVKEAQERGEIPSDLEPALLVFQIQGALELGNYYFILFDDSRQIARARAAIRASLAVGASKERLTSEDPFPQNQ